MTALEGASAPRRPSRGAYLAHGALWLMRFAILAMLAVILAVLYQRYHLSDGQKELVRYVDVEVGLLRQAEVPIHARLEELLGGSWQRGPLLRQAVQDELMPQLVRLRRQAQYPRQAAQTRAVQVLADEYLDVVERLIEVARVVLQVIDDSTISEENGRRRVQQALFTAAAARERWKEHVQMAARAQHLAR